MPRPETDRIEPLRRGSVLLHVGMMKTGTTALQAAASTRRADLLDAGVRYPGRALNHREPAFAVGGKRLGWDGPNTGVIPGIRHWEALVEETRAEGERVVFISNELFAEFDEDVCRRVVDELGGGVGGAVHVLFTLRSLPATVASSWQQYLKTGFVTPFAQWLDETFAPDADQLDPVPKLLIRSQIAALVARWSALVGPDNVTCIVLDPDDRELVSDTVEGLLGLPEGALRAEPEGHLHNRSFTAPEAAMFQQANDLIRQDPDVIWKDFERLVQRGAMKQVLATRLPDEDEPAIEAPRWAIDRAVGWAREQRAGLEDLGVRVVGSLDDLEREPERVPEQTLTPSVVPVELAAEALAGMFRAASVRPTRAASPAPVKRRTASTTRGPVAEGARSLRMQASGALGRTTHLSGRDLALALAGRVVRRLLPRRSGGRATAPTLKTRP